MALSLAQELLIVAGPAGAGKSTLMRELSGRSLNPQIVGRLPAGAADWPRVTANDLESSRPRSLVRYGKAAGLTVHYNTMRPFSRGYEYGSDPALRLLDVIAAPMTVVTIVPEPVLLSRQYRARIAESNEDEWWVPVPPLKAVRRKIRTGLRKTFGRAELPLKPEQLRLMRLYESPDALKSWYKKWKIYLRDRCEQRSYTRVIFVAPRPNLQFELIHPNDRSSPWESDAGKIDPF
jgi:hypothetical protein